jgi:hypothetical protein
MARLHRGVGLVQLRQYRGVVVQLRFSPRLLLLASFRSPALSRAGPEPAISDVEADLAQTPKLQKSAPLPVRR